MSSFGKYVVCLAVLCLACACSRTQAPVDPLAPLDELAGQLSERAGEPQGAYAPPCADAPADGEWRADMQKRCSEYATLRAACDTCTLSEAQALHYDSLKQVCEHRLLPYALASFVKADPSGGLPQSLTVADVPFRLMTGYPAVIYRSCAVCNVATYDKVLGEVKATPASAVHPRQAGYVRSSLFTADGANLLVGSWCETGQIDLCVFF